MLRLSDRLRIRGIRESFTRDENLKKLSEALGLIKHQNKRLLEASIEEFTQLSQRNKKQLLSHKKEFNKLKQENHKRLGELKDELKRLEDRLRMIRTYCY